MQVVNAGVDWERAASAVEVSATGGRLCQDGSAPRLSALPAGAQPGRGPADVGGSRMRGG